jgi:tetratricopeptide (TPR) repeat protein
MPLHLPFLSMVDRCRLCPGVLVCGMLWLAGESATAATPGPAGIDDALLARVEARVANEPEDSVAWRLLALLCERSGQHTRALESYQRAIRWDPHSTAAWCGLGRVQLALGARDQAVGALRRVRDLAPQSDYAQEAEELLRQLGPEAGHGDVQLADFTVDWLRPTDPPLDLLSENQPDPRPQPFFWSLDVGTQYNSNVALAPISRQLSSQADGGFQAFVAPEMEYAIRENELWRFATCFDGYFNLNESHLNDYNLSHYQPGLYVERYVAWDKSEIIPRLAYDFSYDAFQGQRFGSRHSMVSSLTLLDEKQQAWFVLFGVDETEFADDGTAPWLSSLDGWTYTVGGGYGRQLNWQAMNAVQIGVDLQWADLVGSSSRYRGVLLYAEVETQLPFHWTAKTKLAWGYREYPDFEFLPSRNENIWHVGGKIIRSLTNRWLLTANAQYDQFGSQNELFSADRLMLGAYLTWQR